MTKEALMQMLNDEINAGLKTALTRVNALVAENKALKEALAQPEKGLFIDLIAQHEGLADELAQPDYRAVKTYHEGKPVYVSQPEQEPVAWFSTLPDGRLSIKIVGKPTEGNWEPLYTTPPKRPWVGLTDEDIAYAYTLEKKFAMQYVDAKLKEKNT